MLLKKVEKTMLQKSSICHSSKWNGDTMPAKGQGFLNSLNICHPKQRLPFKSKDDISFFDLLSLSSVTLVVYPFIFFCMWSWFGRHIFYWCKLKRKYFFYAGWWSAGSVNNYLCGGLLSAEKVLKMGWKRQLQKSHYCHSAFALYLSTQGQYDVR